MRAKIPSYMNRKDLDSVLFINGIDISTDIDDCNRYLYMNGYTVRKRIKIENVDRIVRLNNTLQKVDNFSGYEIVIGKNDEEYSAIMETERDALLLCVINAIQSKGRIRV